MDTTFKQPFDLNPNLTNISRKHFEYKGAKYELYNIEDPNAYYYKTSAYRSAIVSNGRLVCLAPAKAIPFNDYVSVMNEVVGVYGGTREEVVEPPSASLRYFTSRIVEGTMINLFWDEAHSTWEIASRKNIGCNYWYFKDPAGGISKQLYSERSLGISTLGNAVKQLYSERPLGISTLGNADAFRKQLTFREMFLEALAIGSLADLETDTDFAFLNKECSYSFVLQHPQNHLVELIEKPAAYMTYIYRIEHKDGQPFYSYVKPDQTAGNGRVRYPVDDQTPSSDVSAYGVSSFVGSMSINYETGMRRTHYREEYLELKALRGNNPSIYYQYLTLRKIHKVADFLTHFSQYTDLFMKYEEQFNRFKARLHQMYMDIRVFKKVRIGDISSKRDKYFVEKLHYEVFLPGLALHGKGFKVTKTVVGEFLDREDIMVPMGA
jgi:hypothetical protein